VPTPGLGVGSARPACRTRSGATDAHARPTLHGRSDRAVRRAGQASDATVRVPAPGRAALRARERRRTGAGGEDRGPILV